MAVNFPARLSELPRSRIRQIREVKPLIAFQFGAMSAPRATSGAEAL
jgi:hypothetical protein